MKLIVNPKYEHLTEFLKRIPEGSVKADVVYKHNRNIVTRVTHKGTDLVIKQFKVPNKLNRFIYTWLRESKACRSFEYAGRLLSAGIDTAEPIAYIEIKKTGLFHTGYFISSFLDHDLLFKIDHSPFDIAANQDIIRDFAKFTADMHAKHIFHKDYNSGNIFYHKEGDHYRFALIDINRMRFRKPNKNNVLDGFDRLTLSRIPTVEIAAAYATLRGWNPETLSGAVLMRKGVNMRKRIKKLLKRFTKSSSRSGNH